MNRAVVPISGGLDSTVILSDVSKNHNFDEVHCVTFDYGQKHKDCEVECAKYQAGQYATTHKIIDLSFFKDISGISSLTNSDIAVAKTRDVLGDAQTVNYVPFRNQMILSICCAYAESIGATAVFHGAAQVDSQAGYWDGSTEFLYAFNNITALNRKHRISVEAPLITKSKADIIKLGIDCDIDFSQTWTCYEGAGISCGECPACSSRIKGFLDAGLPDPLPYKRDILWEDLLDGTDVSQTWVKEGR